MQMNQATAAVGMPLLAAADLQDNLLTAANDLERLQSLLSEACDTLLAGFFGASHELRTLHSMAPEAGQCERAIDHLGRAVTALQFQDMASQLISHTARRLRHCTDRLASDAFADDEDGCGVVEESPLRPNPVTQDEMDAGSIDLF
ncbi:MAG: hypothetical protein ABIV63_19695 [Caldimonas sp.]